MRAQSAAIRAASQLKGGLQPGDLIFYNSSDNKQPDDHVAVYLGDGKIVDSPQTCVDGGNGCAQPPGQRHGQNDYVRVENASKPGGTTLPVYGYGRPPNW